MTDIDILVLAERFPTLKHGSTTDQIGFARAIEKVSRRAALEEAAQVAYAHNAIMATTTAQLIENAIRELAKAKP